MTVKSYGWRCPRCEAHNSIHAVPAIMCESIEYECCKCAYVVTMYFELSLGVYDAIPDDYDDACNEVTTVNRLLLRPADYRKAREISGGLR